MNTAVARLRAKTDRDLAVLIHREFDNTKALAARGRYVEAARSADLIRNLLVVANLPKAEREWIERELQAPVTACA